MAAAISLSPATSLRLKPLFTAVRLLSTYRTIRPKLLPSTATKPLITTCIFPPKSHKYHYYICPPIPSGVSIRRQLSSTSAAALSAGETTEETQKVGEFRKRIRIADIKGGSGEGLDKLGQSFVVRGWVRTLRMQSSVTFIEVIIK